MTVEEIRTRLAELNAALKAPDAFSNPERYAAVSREYASAKHILDQWEALERVRAEITSLEEDIRSGDDPELARLAEEEFAHLKGRRDALSAEVKELLNPADPNDNRNVIMEIRAGTGGDESTLFAAELFRMYSRFAEKRGWKCHIVSSNRTGLGGFKEVIFSIEGDRIYKWLKYEVGVHRVQRVPETEKAGRVHTSAATVAVLPEAEEVDIELKQQDLRIDTFMSGGHGGQSVNTTYSAIRVTHLPTGMVITCQDERSQQQNKLKALTILRSRLLALEEEKRMRERAEARKSQIGTGDRSEKIRTYNFPQDRVTDHRIKANFHNIATIMDGGLEPIISALQQAAHTTHANDTNSA